MKKKLQDVTSYKVMSYVEAAKELGWYIKEEESSVNFKCNCENSKIKYSGFFGTEVIECENCGKEIVDLFSPIRTGNATCTVLKASEYDIELDENGLEKYWIAINKK